MMKSPLVPADRLLPDALRLCISLAGTTDELRDWWLEYRHHVAALPPAERERVIAAKDKRKAELQ